MRAIGIELAAGTRAVGTYTGLNDRTRSFQ